MLAVVVLTYDPPDGMLEDCIASVQSAGGADLVIVVDNGDGAARRLAGRGVELLVTGANLGYAGGMNAGIRRALAAGADHVALLNDDTRVDADWVTPLLTEFATDPSVGAVQPMLVFDTDPPTVNSLGVALGVDGAGVDIGYGTVVDDLPSRESRDIEVFTGGAVVLSRAMLDDLGGFDERYGLYYEDVDLALRGHAAGWRYRCVPASVVHHRGGASTSKLANRTAYLRERNRLWVLIGHRRAGDIATGLWLSIRRLRHRPRGVHALALAAGLVAAPRLVAERIRARRTPRTAPGSATHANHAAPSGAGRG